MRGTLPGIAADLAEYMSDISEELYAAGWISGLEWMLWPELCAYRMKAPPVRRHDVGEFMPRLDELQAAADGWVWWLDGVGMQFVPAERWRQIVTIRTDRWPHCTDSDAIAKLLEEM